MKKILAVILVLAMCLSLCSCGEKYICEECGENYESEQAKYSTGPYCRSCNNLKDDRSKYCVCGKPACDASGDSYLCEECHGRVVDAVNNALGGN